jgi:hypothetical protein
VSAHHEVADRVGERYGSCVILRVLSLRQPRRLSRVLVRCDCGAESKRTLHHLRTDRARGASRCGACWRKAGAS